MPDEQTQTQPQTPTPQTPAKSAPVLGVIYKKKIQLNAYPENIDAWVEVVSNPKADVREGMPEDPQARSDYFLSKIVTDWSFVDANGVKLPITPENVAQLSIFDKEQIVASVGQSVLSDSKKNS